MSVVSQFMHALRVLHQETIHHILRYLKSYLAKGILYSKQGHFRIEAFTGIDWVGSIEDRRSTTGYYIFGEGNLVTWWSKKQAVVARCSAGAEYRAMAHGICELMWLKILIEDLGVSYGEPVCRGVQIFD